MLVATISCLHCQSVSLMPRNKFDSGPIPMLQLLGTRGLQMSSIVFPRQSACYCTPSMRVHMNLSVVIYVAKYNIHLQKIAHDVVTSLVALVGASRQPFEHTRQWDIVPLILVVLCA